MTPLDTAYPQHLQQQPPQDSMGGYPMRPQQPGVQFGHMPHTDHMLRGAMSEERPQPQMMQGATPLGPNVEHHERHAPQYDYQHPQQHMQQHPQQHPQQHMQQHPQQHMQQHPQQHMQHPQQQQQLQARFQGAPPPPHMQPQPQRVPAHIQQRLAQQTGPAPVAAEVITKTKSGTSTNKILLIVLVSVIFLGIGIGIVVICRKNKKSKLEMADSTAVFKASEF
jgi:hypothetical protein